MNRHILSFIALMFMFSVITGSVAGKEIIELGTMATEGSIWGQGLSEMNRILMEESDHQLEFSLHFSRSDGQLERLIAGGRLDAALLTGCALGNILPEVFVLQLPMLFSGHEELDYVRGRLTQRFGQDLEEEGYILLGWAEFGFIHLFSKEPIRTQTDLQGTRVWAWDIDPIGEAFIRESGQAPIVLPIESVPASLKKGTVETVYTSPLACIVFGWHTEIRYMSDFRLSAGIGATIISKNRYDRLSDEHKVILRRIMQEYHPELIEAARRINEDSIGILRQQGMKVVKVPPVEKENWHQAAMSVQNRFTGVLYEEELLDEVRNLLDEYNANQ